MKRTMVALCATLNLLACGSDELDRDDVTTIPSGDATGTTWSGAYRIESYTSSCEGRCPRLEAGIFVVDICNVGEKDRETVTVTHEDGRLQIDFDSSVTVTRMVGGINTDGTFEVGGYATAASNQIDVTARVTGRMQAEGRVEAMSMMRAVGAVEDESVDCRRNDEVTGDRD